MPLPTPKAPTYRDLSDWVVLQILDAIRNGTIEPGERLVEREVAERFGVSRAPVRDAFHKLERLDVVERVRPRGVRVREWTAEDAAEVYLMMDALILMSVRLATDRLRADEIEALADIIAEVRAADTADSLDPAMLVRSDQRFHAIVAAATGRRRLASMMESLALPISLYSVSPRSHLEARGWLRMHEELLEHLERRDVDGAVACVLRNAEESELTFMQALQATTSWHDPLLETDARRVDEPAASARGPVRSRPTATGGR